MRINYSGLIVALFSSVLLSACMRAETPQEVTQAFWAAAIEGDTSDVVRFSTLTTPDSYDGFSRNWADYHPSWGRIVIDDDKASLESEFSRPQGPSKSSRSFVTYLIRIDGQWLVDYERTARSINGGVFGDLFSQFDRLSKEFAEQFNVSAGEANLQMKQMLEELEETQKQLGEEASKAMEIYGDELREALQQMDNSIRAPEGNRENPPEETQELHEEHPRRGLLQET